MWECHFESWSRHLQSITFGKIAGRLHLCFPTSYSVKLQSLCVQSYVSFQGRVTVGSLTISGPDDPSDLSTVYGLRGLTLERFTRELADVLQSLPQPELLTDLTITYGFYEPFRHRGGAPLLDLRRMHGLQRLTVLRFDGTEWLLPVGCVLILGGVLIRS